MLEILNDQNTFKIVESDQTISQEDKLIRILKQLKNDGFITVISTSGTFNNNLAKMLASKLKYSRKNDTIITNTFDIVNEADKFHIKLISVGITSLFTNVPLQRTIEIILDKLYGPKYNGPSLRNFNRR
jgi:hypothetical protein